MKVDGPTFQFTETLVFRGVLQNKYGEYPIHDLVVTRYRHRHPTEISFAFQFQRDERNNAMSYFASGRVVAFAGTLEYRDRGMLIAPPQARLLLRLIHGSARSIEGIVEQLDISPEPLLFAPSEQAVSVWLTPTSVALRSYEVMLRYRTGELVERDFDSPSEPFLVPTSTCSLSLSLGMHRESVTIEGENAHLEIPVVTLDGTAAEQHLSQDVSALIDSLSVELKPLECVLSLFSRRHVRAYNFAVYSYGMDTQTMFRETTRYIQGYSTPAHENPLVSAHALDPSSLAVVIGTLVHSPYRLPIEKAINFLLAYWQSRFIEDRVAAAFTAFETLVNGIAAIDGTAHTLPNETFRALSENVKDAIKVFATKEALPAQTRARLYEKVGELQRVALGASAETLLERHSVEWRDLWRLQSASDNQALRREVGRAYGLRSALLHAGQMDALDDLLADAASIHALAERLVCRLLDVKDEWLDHLAHHHAMRGFSR